MPPPLRFLVIQTAFLGDVILATAVVEKLRAHYPDAEIDFLLRRGNESLLHQHPYLRRVLVWDKTHHKYAHLWQLWRQIRRERYDHVINLQRHAATGLLTALSGAGTTAGFASNPLARLFTRRVPHDFADHTHETARNQQLIAPLTDDQPARPRLYPTADDEAAARVHQRGPYVCVAPASVWFTKQWPADQWADLLRQLPVHYRVCLLGSPADVARCAEVLARSGLESSGRVSNLAGQLSLLASAALVRGAVLNYVNDSAPLHLCSAVNAPTCAVYCSTVPAFGYGPLADGAVVVEIESPLACRPCGRHGHRACPLGHFRCATGIRTDQLLAALSPL